MADDEVIRKWDDVENVGWLRVSLDDAFADADDKGFALGDALVHVVPAVPNEPILAGARISGMKLARIDGVIGIYLFAEGPDA